MASDPTPAEQFSGAVQAFMTNVLGSLGAPDPSRPLQAAGVDALKLAALQARLLGQHAALWQAMLARYSGGEAAAVADRSDRRFSSAEWRRDPWFDYLRQSYLINSQFAADWVEALDTDTGTKERLRFITRQVADAISPSNFTATNPDALKLALETKGESIARGVRQLIEDVHKGRISTTDESHFEIGRNIAATEGAVVYQNEVMQLIQYKPLSGTVFERPLVMIPPCINKYYILDLQPENSLVRFAVEQGHSVFMVSWRNVEKDLGHLTWDDYVGKGVLRALEVAREVSGADTVNALGFCVGGTLLAVALAVAAARGENGVESATFLASMLDFSDTGEIGLFIDEASVALREGAIGRGGVMPGRDLALVFSALRANDLVWSYVVSNYLKGKSPEAFDLLYWNADSTRMPARMHSFYLRNMYLKNLLGVPGGIQLKGVPIDLGAVPVPSYFISTVEDHIAPWKTTYKGARYLGGPVRFVLGGSGHIAGIVNPPAAKKYHYWTSDALPQTPEEWFAGAKQTPGSWWEDWQRWIDGLNGGDKVPARIPGNAIEDAPGSYAMLRLQK